MNNKFVAAVTALFLITHAPAQAWGGKIVFDPSNYSKNAANLAEQIRSAVTETKNAGFNAASAVQLLQNVVATKKILDHHIKNVKDLENGNLVDIGTKTGVAGLKHFILNNREQVNVDERVIEDIRRSESGEMPESLRQTMLADPQKWKLRPDQVARLQDPNQDHYDTYDVYAAEIEANKEALTPDEKAIQTLVASATKQAKKSYKDMHGLGLDARSINDGFERAFKGYKVPNALTPAQFDEHVREWNLATHNAIKNNFRAQEINALYSESIDNWLDNEVGPDIDDIEGQLQAMKFNAWMMAEVVRSLNELQKMTASHFRAQGKVWRANMLNSGGGGGGGSALDTPFDRVYKEESQVKKYKGYCENSRHFRNHPKTKSFCECIRSKETRKKGFKAEKICYDSARVDS